ncbi:Irc8p KNAG_0E02650 [Huiozyma naganishii CBS 8797]|uniref:Uncharacterized protein n=1 Tax=Huiozyma naganishii (strain ATCC MYA-139 / BCRC 22969 / CBS 8797 / KCTC 17520 / NBRC 10181 / NCYC 3082 / Yp74L-3) TaxID=1071383 RepID=J7S6R6_HUIN7|nr:hypothetical protein KNAG_0E02650 [Kazachstania naganishii CBS 8797]CCK70524.1 hypothetical protein KNAG_0E02650 [Kazachstania naganishii CBS 8797]
MGNNFTMLRSLAMGTILISLLTGSLSIALISLYHKTEAVLIVITVSSFLYSLLVFYTLVRRTSVSDKAFVYQQLVILVLQLIDFGCTVDFFNSLVKNSRTIVRSNGIRTHQDLLVTLEAALLLNLFINGIFLGSNHLVNYVKPERGNAVDQEKQRLSDEDDSYVLHNKFVPMKDSAQTLTPDLTSVFYSQGTENRNVDWMIQKLNKKKSNDTFSNHSVIKHQLGRVDMLSDRRNISSNGAIRQPLNYGTYVPDIETQSRVLSRKNPAHRLKFKGKRFRFKSNRKNNKLKNEALDKSAQEKKEMSLNVKYLTRLSTISDLPRSFVNLLNRSNNDISRDMVADDGRASIIEPKHDEEKFLANFSTSDKSPRLAKEKDAIERIDNALLPPFLHAHNSNNTTLDPVISRAESPLIPDVGIGLKEVNAVERDIETLNVPTGATQDPLSPAPQLRFSNNSRDEYRVGNSNHVEFPSNISLNMWKNDKLGCMRKASDDQNKPMKTYDNDTLLSPFQYVNSENITPSIAAAVSSDPELETKQDFSFPVKKPEYFSNLKGILSTEIDVTPISDNISELDEYLNDFTLHDINESQIIEESLQQRNIATTLFDDRKSNSPSRSATKHSPTKSLASIMSGGALTGNSNSLKKRASVSFFGCAGPLNHTRTNSQLQYSGTYANISQSVQSSPTKQRFKRIGKKLSLSSMSDKMTQNSFDRENSYNISEFSHERGKSIDFSYLHMLQNTHSPSKSVSGISVTSNGQTQHQQPQSPQRKSYYHSDARPHSIAAVEKVIRSASSMIYKHPNDTITGDDPQNMNDMTIQNITLEQRAMNSVPERNVSNQESTGSENVYPDTVMGEYDREKWNAMKNLNIIDADGHITEDIHLPTNA